MHVFCRRRQFRIPFARTPGDGGTLTAIRSTASRPVLDIRIRALRATLALLAASTLAACQGGFGTSTGANSTNATPAATAAATPVVSLTPSPSRVAKGDSATLTWDAVGADSCTASGGWSGTKPPRGSVSVSTVNATTNYVLTCSGPGGTSIKSAQVIVAAAAPSVTLTATPSTIATGASTTLTWSSTNASSCSAAGAWSGALALSGTQATGPLSASAVYTVSCTGNGGTASQSTTVTVTTAAPVITLSASPSSVNAGGSTTLTWGSRYATACSASGAWTGNQLLTGSQSTRALDANSTFTLTCTGPGGTATQSAVVSVTPSVPTVSFGASPSTVVKGGVSTLTWSSANTTTCVASGAWTGTKPVSGTQHTAGLTAPATYTLTCSGAGGRATQSTTVSVGATSSAPTVSLSVGPSAVTSGGASTLNWSSTNATSCTASGAWSGSKSTSGSQSTGALSANATYLLTCTGTGGSAMQSATVSVTSPLPTISFSANPSTVSNGGSTTLNWSAANAASCSASGSWSGAEPASGSQTVGPINTNSSSVTYLLICTGSGGSVMQSATVSITPAAPTITLTASPSTVKSGATSVLTWNATNASACTASGGWTGSEPVSGTQTTVSLGATTAFGLACTGPGGSATQSVTVTVPVAAPTITLRASPASINIGGVSTLNWSSTNATACAASGGWSGALATAGSSSTGALSNSTTYTLLCTGIGGSTIQSVSVTVVAANSGSGTATLSWTAPTTNTDGTAVTPLIGYHIYYGNSAAALTQSVAVSGATTLSYQVTGLASGTWYFAVAADAADGSESALSSVGTKTI